MAQRFIDRNVRFYGEDEAEYNRAMLRYCPPAFEPYWKARLAATLAVRDALIALRDLIDNPPAGGNTDLER